MLNIGLFAKPKQDLGLFDRQRTNGILPDEFSVQTLIGCIADLTFACEKLEQGLNRQLLPL
jgi:hypothetical protein